MNQTSGFNAGPQSAQGSFGIPSAMPKLVSVIVPAYNATHTIADCMRSVQLQSYANVELIIVDDGSTDETLSKARVQSLRDERVKVIALSHGGQGRARNKGLEAAQGDYILFLDADDMLVDTAIEAAINRCELDGSDYAVFSFQYLKNGKTTFTHAEDYFEYRLLTSKEQLAQMLDCVSYYSVTRLYRASYLKENGLRYPEGYLYEDIPFYLNTVLCASRVSVLHAPLYIIRVQKSSSTRRNRNSSQHADGYIAAVHDSVDALLAHQGDDGIDAARYYWSRYVIRRGMEYYYDRMPKQYRGSFAKRFVGELNRLGDYPILSSDDELSQFLQDKRVFEDASGMRFRALVRYEKKAKPGAKKIKYAALQKKDDVATLPATAAKKLLAPVQGLRKKKTVQGVDGRFTGDLPIVLFMGFDYRYTGNSRYLYESLLQRDDVSARLLFVTDSELVDEENRVEPRTSEAWDAMARAKVIVFESWVSNRFKKRRGQLWIQLWHGTPIKRLLYDSNEFEVYSRNRKNKTIRFNDISRWNYLLVESQISAQKFRQAFLFPPDKMIVAQYPRVSWLVRNRDNDQLRSQIRSKYGLSAHKPIVLYLPTWRDYNYGLEEDEYDLSYLLDCSKLQDLLGDAYEVIVKDHAYRHVEFSSNARIIDPSAETQEFLLVADYVITDYSSVVFDAFAAKIPVCLYIADFQKYSSSRGVYEDIWDKLNSLACESVDDIANAIRTGCMDEANVRAREAFEDELALSSGVEVLIRGIVNKNSTSPKTLYALRANDAHAVAASVLADLPMTLSPESSAFVLLDNTNEQERAMCKGIVESNNSVMLSGRGDSAVLDSAHALDALRVVFVDREDAIRLKPALNADGAEVFLYDVADGSYYIV